MGAKGLKQPFHLRNPAHARGAHVASQQREAGRFHARQAARRAKG